MIAAVVIKVVSRMLNSIYRDFPVDFVVGICNESAEVARTDSVSHLPCMI